MTATLHVLIVEDDADFAESMAILLELEGHRVRTAPDGDTGLGLLERHDFHLVFLDVGLPGKSGFETLRDIRRRKPGTQVVLMSGYSAEQLARHPMDDAVLAVLSKPFEPDEIGAVLEAASNAGPGAPGGGRTRP